MWEKMIFVLCYLASMGIFFYIGVQYGYRTKGKQKISLWLSYSKDQVTLQRLGENRVTVLHQSTLLPDKANGTKIILSLD